MAKRSAKIIKVSGYLKTFSGVGVDCTVEVVLRPGAEAITIPYTWQAGDRADVALALSDWFKAQGIDPAAEAADVDFSARILSGIKLEAGHRIRQIMPAWMVERAMTGGEPISEEIKAAVAAIRERSNALEQGSPLPRDYADDKHWK